MATCDMCAGHGRDVVDGIGVKLVDAEPASAAAGGDHGDDPRGVPVPRRRDRRGGHEEGGAVRQQGLREQARHSRRQVQAPPSTSFILFLLFKLFNVLSFVSSEAECLVALLLSCG